MKNLDKHLREEFSRIVKIKRKRLGLTQAELAKSLGFNRGVIMHIEQKVQMPSLYQAIVISNKLDFELNPFKKAVYVA